jgi:hypothetical protein
LADPRHGFAGELECVDDLGGREVVAVIDGAYQVPARRDARRVLAMVALDGAQVPDRSHDGIKDVPSRLRNRRQGAGGRRNARP